MLKELISRYCDGWAKPNQPPSLAKQITSEGGKAVEQTPITGTSKFNRRKADVSQVEKLNVAFEDLLGDTVEDHHHHHHDILGQEITEEGECELGSPSNLDVKPLQPDSKLQLL